MTWNLRTKDEIHAALDAAALALNELEKRGAASNEYADGFSAACTMVSTALGVDWVQPGAVLAIDLLSPEERYTICEYTGTRLALPPHR